MSSLEEARGLCMEMQHAHTTPLRRASVGAILSHRYGFKELCHGGLKDSVGAETAR